MTVLELMWFLWRPRIRKSPAQVAPNRGRALVAPHTFILTGAPTPFQPRRRYLARVLEAALDRLPVDIAQERVDVGRRVRAEVDVIGVLVHVEREQGDAARDRLAVIGSVLIDEPAVPRHPRQQHPPRTA